MKTYKDWICRYYSEHEDGEPDGEIIQELIRCKDCKHYDKFISQNIGQGWCDVAAWRGRYMGDNDYCSRAERKETA